MTNFNGHTVFSLFQTEGRVLDNIENRFEEMDVVEEEDFLGRENQSSIIRRLYRALILPTQDINPNRGGGGGDESFKYGGTINVLRKSLYTQGASKQRESLLNLVT